MPQRFNLQSLMPLRLALTGLALALATPSALAGSGFNRCKKFSNYPAIETYVATPRPPNKSSALPARLRDRLAYIVDTRADYAGYLKVIEIPLESGYRYWFWDLRSGRMIPGPGSDTPALWRDDSRLFIALDEKSHIMEYDRQGYRGSPRPDTARYYVWDEDQHDQEQSMLLELSCGE